MQIFLYCIVLFLQLIANIAIFLKVEKANPKTYMPTSVLSVYILPFKT